MNRYIKKAVCLTAALAIAVAGLAGCGKQTEDESGKGAMGRYLEEEVSLPGNTGRVLAMERLNDNSLSLLTEDKETGERCLWKSADLGKSWEEDTLPGGLGLADCAYIDWACISKEGDIAVSAMPEASEVMVSQSFSLLYAKKGESLKALNLDGEKTDDMKVITGIAFSDSGKLIATYTYGTVCVIDPESGHVEQNIQPGETIQQVTNTEDTLLLLTDKGLKAYDMNTGESAEADRALSDELLKEMETEQKKLRNSVVFGYGKEEDKLFYCAGSGIYRHILGGTVVEQAVNGSLTSIGNPKTMLISLAVMDDDSFLVACSVDAEYKIYRYSYSADTSSVPEKEIKVYSLEDCSVLRQAISVYQKQNPDVYVDLEIGMSGEDSVTASDALRTLNTDIMAGKGPDILILDGMPVENYIQKGLLEDITDTVEAVSREDGLFENIMRTFEKDDKIYAVPLGFLLPVVQGDEAVVNAAESMNTLAEQIAEIREANPHTGRIMIPTDSSDFLEIFYNLENAAMRNEDGTLNEEALKAFLENMKKLYGEPITQEEQENTIRYFSAAEGVASNLDGLRLQSMVLLSQQSKAGAGWIGSVSQLVEILGVNEACGLDYTELKSEGKSVFLPYQSVGISSKSKEKELASDFLKALLGVEVQGTLNAAFPINQKGYEKVMEFAKTTYGGGGDDAAGGASITMSDSSGSMSSVNLGWPGEEELDGLKALLEQAEVPASTDDTIWNAVKEQGEKYLNEGLGLDEACSNIIQKVNLYLAE